jgi:hypothetical protein
MKLEYRQIEKKPKHPEEVLVFMHMEFDPEP